MDDQPIHNRKELKELRQQLRNNAIPAECKLWNRLKQKQLVGRKFRRQNSVGDYILNFYCPAEKLCIELDGAYHFTSTQRQLDELRTEYLNSLNITVLRFNNEEVLENIEAVLEAIKAVFQVK